MEGFFFFGGGRGGGGGGGEGGRWGKREGVGVVIK